MNNSIELQNKLNNFFSWWPKDTFGFLNPYIIAEIGVNHAGDIVLAKKQILQAKNAGAHAVKFQAYKADTIASKDFSPSYWDLTKETTTNQYELFSKYDQFSEYEYKELAIFCKENEIDFSCTPFDADAVSFLNPLVPFFKIASADITNKILLLDVIQTKKPIILSTGASSWEEIERTVDFLLKNGCEQLALLHCVLNYPTPMEHAQMKLMDKLSEKYQDKALIGYSDHIPENIYGFPALDMAVLRGAVIIEKHFTHDITIHGNDHYHAFSEASLKVWVDKLAKLNIMYGKNNDRNLEWEKQAIQNARRRVGLNKNKNIGETIFIEDILPLRASKGIKIEEVDSILGKKLKIKKNKGNILFLGDFL